MDSQFDLYMNKTSNLAEEHIETVKIMFQPILSF